ncbi:MAG: PilZ domain-containing protein [Bdellovibrionales bacterium]|nr:PilZ domain-containing protein [Bdellovibrionales bacterium]
MRARPKIFVGMTAALVGVALSFPLQVMALFGQGPAEWLDAWALVSPLNRVVMGWCLVGAALSWRASPWIKWWAPLAVAAVAWNNWVVGSSGVNFNLTESMLATVGFAALQGFWLHPQARFLIANPKRRWWMTPERKRVSLTVFVRSVSGATSKGTTFDVSETGAFVPFGIRELNNHPDALLHRLVPGERVEVSFVVGAFKTVSCEAEVVRINSQPQGNYPAGVGLRVLRFHGESAQDLHDLLAA